MGDGALSRALSRNVFGWLIFSPVFKGSCVAPTVTLSWALTPHLLCFQGLLLVVVPPEWLGFLELSEWEWAFKQIQDICLKLSQG